MTMNRIVSLKRIASAVLTVSVSVAIIGIVEYGQTQPASAGTCDRIAQIIDMNIKQGERSFDGVKTYTRVPLNTTYIDEVKMYGKRAFPCLAEISKSDNAPRRGVAIDLLGTLGGPHAIVPLKDIVGHDLSPGLRLAALAWLAGSPDLRIREILISAAKHNSVSEVRAEARRLLDERQK